MKGILRPYQVIAEEYLCMEGIPVFRNIASAYADDIISVKYLDLTKDDPKVIINQILDTYVKSSKMKRLMNNETKPFMDQDVVVKTKEWSQH